MMTRFSPRTAIAAATLLAALGLPPPVLAQVRAYVPSGLGDVAPVVTQMEALGWNVTQGDPLDLASDAAYDAFDVVWLVWAPGESTRDYLRQAPGDFERFTGRGGVLVVNSVQGGDAGPELGPARVHAVDMPAAGVVAVTISAANHPLVLGVGIGGTALTDADLDPGASGGRGYLGNVPSGAVTIARNAAGPVLLEYSPDPESAGRVLIDCLFNPSADALANLVRYAGSLVP